MTTGIFCLSSLQICVSLSKIYDCVKTFHQLRLFVSLLYKFAPFLFHTLKNTVLACEICYWCVSSRSRGTLDIERFKNLVSLSLETAEEKMKNSWHSRVLELFTGDQRLARGRLSSGFHSSVSTLLANQVGGNLQHDLMVQWREMRDLLAIDT